ncbi:MULTISPECIES: hypothetical protein [Citrobacter]|nr:MULTISPECIES: hypothetical protein [Citrobacter]
MKKIREDNKKMRALPSGIFWQGSTPGKWQRCHRLVLIHNGQKSL